MDEHNTQHSHGQDLLISPNMFRDKFHHFFFVWYSVSRALQNYRRRYWMHKAWWTTTRISPEMCERGRWKLRNGRL